jgi:hypothetical protein
MHIITVVFPSRQAEANSVAIPLDKQKLIASLKKQQRAVNLASIIYRQEVCTIDADFY